MGGDDTLAPLEKEEGGDLEEIMLFPQEEVGGRRRGRGRRARPTLECNFSFVFYTYFHPFLFSFSFINFPQQNGEKMGRPTMKAGRGRAPDWDGDWVCL